MRTLNRSLRLMKKPTKMVLPRLHFLSFLIVGYPNASFANHDHLTSQLGLNVLLKDKFDNASVIHCRSRKCHRITRSVLAAELYALTHCSDFVRIMSQDMSIMLDRKEKIIIFTDFKSLIDTLTKLTTITEKRLLIGIAVIKEKTIRQVNYVM